MRNAAAGLAIAITTAGCVTVSMHDHRPTDVAVVDAATGQPLPNLPITVRYDHDSYGVRWVLRNPGSSEGTTDATGHATIALATWQHRIWIDLGPQSAITIDAAIVEKGGELRSFPRGQDGRTYIVTFKPIAKS